MFERRRFGAGALGVVLALVATVALPTPAGALTQAPGRLGGGNRYETAALLSRSTFLPGVPAVVLASGVSFPDGLVAGPLGGLLGGPVLLTEPDALPSATVDELTRLRPAQVVLVGGEGVIDGAVATQVAALGAAVRRVAGDDRYGTAAAVAAEFAPSPDPVLLATGEHYADALGGGAVAAGDKRPLLLTSPGALPPAILAQLVRLQAGAVSILGGTDAVNETVRAAVAAVVPNVARVAGADRYGTAALLSTLRPSGRAFLAVGHGWADALAAAAVAGPARSPLLLTEPDCVPATTVDALRNLGWPDLVAVGGSGVVSPAALAVTPCTPVADGLVAPGVSLTTLRLAGPRIARVLAVDRSKGYDLVAAPATGRMTGRLPTTLVARRWNAVAAVNGDFFHLEDGTPVHALASRGRLLRSPGLTEALVAVDSARPTTADAGSPKPHVEMVLPGEVRVGVERVNDGPAPAGGTSLTTREAGGSVDSTGACAVVLTPTAPPAPAPTGDTAQPFTVGSVQCDAGPIAVGSDDVWLVPKDGPGAALVAGAPVTFTWRLQEAWSGRTEAIGGNCMLVDRGAISTDVINRPEQFFKDRVARTAIGWKADGTLLLVTVDRQTNVSVGMTPRELADLLLAQGAVTAVNLDGGGSTTMVARGLLVNKPSDTTGERPIGPALLVVPTGTAAPPDWR
jgi:putative cell wall-binding protein